MKKRSAQSELEDIHSSPAKRYKWQQQQQQLHLEQIEQLQTLQVEQQVDKTRLHFYRVIQSLEKENLSSILTNLLSIHPELEEKVQYMLPKPTLPNVIKLLEQSEKRLIDSFPYSKQVQGKSTDYSYNRVKPFLSELKDQILFYMDYFCSTSSYTPANEFEYPDNSMRYLHWVSECVMHRFPTWQSPLLNKESRGDLLERITLGWRMAVSEISCKVSNGKIYPITSVKEWASYLSSHYENVNGEYGMKNVCDEFVKGLGWLMDASHHDLIPSFESVATIESSHTIQFP